MANKSTKTKAKSKCKTNLTSAVCKTHSFWMVTLLLVALIIVTTLGVVSINKLESERRTDLDIARLAVFDDIATNFIYNQEVRTDDKTVQEMTGYGISDEDGVFYITFNYYLLNDDGTVDSTAHPAIVYFWEDAERGTYSHAYSYPDDPTYHPDGIYVEKFYNRLPLSANQ